MTNNIPHAVENSSLYQMRKAELGLENVTELYPAYVEVVKDAVLTKLGFDLSDVRGGRESLLEAYQKVISKGTLKIGEAKEYLEEDLKKLRDLAHLIKAREPAKHR